MSGLVPYDQARIMLAEAKSVDDVKSILDKAVAMKEYARRAADRSLEIDAAEIRFHAERRLGQMIAAQKETFGLHKGGRPSEKTASEPEGVLPVRLEDIGISHKLSAHAQKMAAVPAPEFEARIGAWREEVSTGEVRVTMDLLRIGEAAINGARSIMGSRQEPDDSLDYFPTPPWATRALMERVFPHLGIRPDRAGSYLEPACGEGHIAEVLREYCHDPRIVVATDVFDYGYGDALGDFLEKSINVKPTWIITNPPFGDKAIGFVQKALDLSTSGVAMFFRSQWAVEGIERYEQVFRNRAPSLCAFFVERVNLCKGRWDPDGTTATAYCWLVWIKNRPSMPPFWIPPGCREALTKPDDAERFTQHPVAKRNEAPEPEQQSLGIDGEEAAA